MRTLAVQLLSPQQRTFYGECFVSMAPQKLQRSSERLFDFPITSHIRANPILLIRIPRTGSVSTSIFVYGKVDGIPHRTAAFYQRSDPAFFNRATKIAVVRNPWDRVVSAYNFLCANGSSLAKPNPQTQRTMRRLRSLEQLVFDYLEPNIQRLDRLDPVLHHQHSYVCDSADNLIVDRIFHAEDFEALNSFMVSCGLQHGVPHLNASTHAEPGDTRLPARLIEAIGSIYAKDIALFGYGGAAPSPQHALAHAHSSV